MFSRFLPRETSFFDFFERHSLLTVQGAKEFLVLTSEGSNIAACAKRIKEVEHEADVVTHQCVAALHKTFVTPIERDDIHRLISRMDDIMDYVEAAAERLSLYEIVEMSPEIRELAGVLLRAAEKVLEAVKGLRNLKQVDVILRACVDVNRLENEADTILRIAVARLFKAKDPITVIKWKEIYDDLESATDRCEDVANIIEGVILEHV